MCWLHWNIFKTKTGKNTQLAGNGTAFTVEAYFSTLLCFWKLDIFLAGQKLNSACLWWRLIVLPARWDILLHRQAMWCAFFFLHQNVMTSQVLHENTEAAYITLETVSFFGVKKEPINVTVNSQDVPFTYKTNQVGGSVCLSAEEATLHSTRNGHKSLNPHHFFVSRF